MAENCQITLANKSFLLDTIAEKNQREVLVSVVSGLNSSEISEQELRKYFKTIQLALGAFAQKICGLECNILELKKDQLASESRMESMYLRAQLEIQQLRTEISEIRLNKTRINQIARVAKVLQGNAYAPYAIKSLVDGVMGHAGKATNPTNHSTKLPVDFQSRLEFAQQNGFKWNQNNRKPNKPTKQLLTLEEWEDQFCAVEGLTTEQILDKKYVSSIGAGAIAGALMYLERELGALLPERKTLSVFNCYQRAVKTYRERGGMAAQTPCVFDIKVLITNGFSELSEGDIDSMVKRLKSKDLSTVDQLLSGLKRAVSKTLLPTFITYDDPTTSDTQKLYDIQNGKYDHQIVNFCKKYSLAS